MSFRNAKEFYNYYKKITLNINDRSLFIPNWIWGGTYNKREQLTVKN